MPEFLERKLKKEYGANSSIPYKVMNKLGVMHGNKETAKGKAEEKKHEVASKMKHSWHDFAKSEKAIGKSVKRHIKKEHLPF